MGVILNLLFLKMSHSRRHLLQVSHSQRRILKTLGYRGGLYVSQLQGEGDVRYGDSQLRESGQSL